MATSAIAPEPASSLLSRSPMTVYLVAAVVALLVVLGGVAALGGFSGGSSGPPTYSVTFTETGLPSGTNWSVTLVGSTLYSTTSSVIFTESAGTYEYIVGVVRGYSASPSSGSVVVTDRGILVSIEFGSSGIPIGSAFAAGNPVSSTCPTGDTYAANGCQAGDSTYTLTIEASSVEFDNVLFKVDTATGAVYNLPTGAGGFSLLNISGFVAAQVTPIPAGGLLYMSAPWSVYSDGYGNSSALTALFTIVLDMGTTSTVGTGLYFVALGTGGYAGSTSPLALP